MFCCAATTRAQLGARRFKCTTIPILRKDYGVVGALYISDHVLATAGQTAEFFRLYGRIDMHVEENILSKDEYRLAQAGNCLAA